MKTIPSVVAVIQMEGKVLLLKRYPYDRSFTGWCLPGGKVDPGETDIEALVREVKEETNFTVDRVRFIDRYISEKGDKRYEITAYWVTCRGPDYFKLNREEFADYRYVYPQAALGMELAGPTTRKVIQWASLVVLEEFHASSPVVKV